MLYSNTDRLYSQWINSVIYWIINHCTDWAQPDMMSFRCQFDIHEVTYHIYSRVMFTIDSITSFLQINDVQNVRKNTDFSPNKSNGKF